MKFVSQKLCAIFLIILAVAVSVPLFALDHSLLWYWIFGLGFGCILQRSHVCFVSATSDPIIYGSTDQFRGILIGILVASFGFTTVKYLSGGMYDSMGVSALSFPLILGAFLFGVGMILAGSCCSGMFIRLGEGQLIHLVTILSVILGYDLATTHYQIVWAPFIEHAPVIFLPEKLGWPVGVGINLLILLIFYILARKKEGQPSPVANTSYLKGGICLGLLSIVHLAVLKNPWSVSGAFYWIEEFFRQVKAQEVALIPAALGSNLRNLGLLFGALISVLLSSGFSLQKIHSKNQILKSVIGGLLMGYGVCIAGGCNITAFFTAAAALSLSGWIFMIALFIGAFVGVRILYKLI